MYIYYLPKELIFKIFRMDTLENFIKLVIYLYHFLIKIIKKNCKNQVNYIFDKISFNYIIQNL